MFHKILAVFWLFAMVSCTPSYAEAPVSVLTAEHCIKGRIIARQILVEFQQGASQIQVMHGLNTRAMGDYGVNGDITKVYLQLNVSAFKRNLDKGFRIDQVLKKFDSDCEKSLGMKL